MTRLLTVCSDCGELIPLDETEIVNGKHICKACIENYFTCEYCGLVHHNDEAHRTADGQVCEECFEAHYYYCEECEEYHTSTEEIDGYELCESCADRLAHCCEECGEYHLETNMTQRRGNWYCEDCLPSDWRDNWWDKENISWQQFEHSEKGLYLGIELECDTEEYPDVQDIARSIEELDGFFLCKEDGSLSAQGIEIVSHPATPEYHLTCAPWNKALRTMLENDYTSHNNGRCGLHIHVSRLAFGNSQSAQGIAIQRVLSLFEKFWQPIVVFSRRKDFSYCEKNPKDAIAKDISVRYMYGHAREYQGGRYRAINLNNSETVEFRLWRGTLNENTFRATVQFTAGIVAYCKDVTKTHIDNITWYDLMDELMPYCKEACKCDCKELSRYLLERGLIMEEVEECVS